MKRAVVKLGGSTASAAEMDTWISALAGSALPLVIVPGGGPFADQVRQSQVRMGFSETAAHAMAILAMDQFGTVILDRDRRLTPARSLENVRRALEGEGTPVWLPSQAAIPASDIKASWDITSDSLAAWLAGKIGADALLLIKQTAAFQDDCSIESLTEAGIVDARLSTMLPVGVELYLAGPSHAATAGKALSSGALPGTRVARAPGMVRSAG